MAEHDGTESASRREDWAAWLLRNRLARGKRPVDLVHDAKARGMKLSTGQITNWEKRRNPASPESARLMAELLNADPAEALRAAGHEDWALFIEEQRAGAPARPNDGDLEFIAKLRESPDPEMHKLADAFEADLERARRLARFEYSELQRQRAANSDDSATAHNGVNKSA